MDPICHNCIKRIRTSVTTCPRCNKATYCSTACMSADSNDHSILCFTMDDLAPPPPSAAAAVATTAVQPKKETLTTLTRGCQYCFGQLSVAAIGCPQCWAVEYCSTACMNSDRKTHFIACFAASARVATATDPSPPPKADTKQNRPTVQCITCRKTLAQDSAIHMRGDHYCCSEACRFGHRAEESDPYSSGDIKAAPAMLLPAMSIDTPPPPPVSATRVAPPPLESKSTFPAANWLSAPDPCHRCGIEYERGDVRVNELGQLFCSATCLVLACGRVLNRTCARCYKSCDTERMDLNTGKYYCSESCRYPVSTPVDLSGEQLYPLETATTTHELSALLKKRIEHDVDRAMWKHRHPAAYRKAISESLYPTSVRMKLLERATEQLLQKQFGRHGLVCKVHNRHVSYTSVFPECTANAFLKL